MILNGLKNFAKNLKYFIIPLGIIFLFFLLGISIAIPRGLAAITDMVDEVKTITSNAELKPGVFLDAVLQKIFALDWAFPERVVSTVTSFSWLKATFKECFFALVGEDNAREVINAVNGCINRLMFLGIMVGILSVVGCVVGYFVTRSEIKQSSAKAPLKKRLLYGTIELAGILPLMALMAFITYLWEPFIIIAIIILIPGVELWHIAVSCWEYAYKKVKIKEIMNVKVFFLSLATNFIIIGITLTIAVLLGLFVRVGNILIAFLLLSIIEVTLATNAVNIASYIKNYVEERLAQEVAENVEVTEYTELDEVKEEKQESENNQEQDEKEKAA